MQSRHVGRSVAHVCTVDLTARFLLLPQLIGLRDDGWTVSVICAPGPRAAELEREGIRHVPWPSATRSWNPRADARAFAELVRIFRTERFDVVHTHNPKPGVLGRIAARIARVPRVINTVHGYYASPGGRLARVVPVMTAEWVASRFSDMELFQSEEDLQWARRLRVGRHDRSLLLGNGVDLGRFPASLDTEAAADAPGRPRHRRRRPCRYDRGPPRAGEGHLRADRGSPHRAHRLPTRTLRVLGPLDADKADALSTALIEAASDDVLFAGWSDDVAEVLAISDVFVLASWREGMPRSAIEAAASGLPSVLTDIRGCREVIRDGIEGRLVPPRSPARLAEAILELVQDSEVRERMGSAARARAEQRFDERRVVSTVVRRLERLIGRRPRGDAVSGPRVLVIGLDGAEPSSIRTGRRTGVMRFVRELMQDGASGVLRSTMPPYTPTAWTSIITGVNPGRHGVFGFTRWTDDGREVLVDSSVCRCKTVWDYLTEEGRPSIIVNVPITYPPRDIEGYSSVGWARRKTHGVRELVNGKRASRRSCRTTFPM